MNIYENLAALDREYKSFDISGLGNLTGYGLYRGNPSSPIMLIGEGLGEDEVKQGKPFVGKAGVLLNRIFASVGLDTNSDCYLTNIVPYRPVAPESSGRKNVAPTKEQIVACRHFLEKQFQILSPKLVVLLGKIAAQEILETTLPMSELAGQSFRSNKYTYPEFFVMIHPAALLHSQRFPEQYQAQREAMWLHVRKLRNKVDLLRGNELTYPELERTN